MTCMTARLVSRQESSKRVLYACARTHTRLRYYMSDISDRSNPQRELGTLIFLPDDDGNQKPRPGGSNVPTFRYGKIEFPDKGHQERLDLCEAAMCG